MVMEKLSGIIQLLQSISDKTFINKQFLGILLKITGIAILAEACLVWTTFGVGYCLLITISMFLVHWVLDRRGRHAA
jgi:hypothetical protein